MNDREIGEKIRNAVNHTVPDSWEAISSRISSEGTVIDMTDMTKQPKSHKTLIRTLALGTAAALILGTGIFTASRILTSGQVEAVVSLDVNPSIEMQVNAREKVVSAQPLNTDAEAILDGMDLKGTDIRVAVNAVIGSMLQNGYIDELSNAILVSVENKDTQKGEEMTRQLTDEINEILNASAIHGAVISQLMNSDDDLKQLAQSENISAGKAAMIQSVMAQRPALTFSELAGLSINELSLLSTGSNTFTTTGTTSDAAYIGVNKAKEAALQHAGLAEKDTSGLTVELDWDSGRMTYDVKFASGNYLYDYEIDALTGKILEQEKDTLPAGVTDSGASLDAAAARDAALKDAGLILEQIWDLDLDYKYSLYYQRFVYEVDFESADADYDYKIDASTGEILENHREPQQNTRPGTTGQVSGDLITSDAALKAALQHAGVSEADIIGRKVKLDYDDGVYEVEFKAAGVEYEYEIGMTTGKVVNFEKEVDDDFPGNTGNTGNSGSTGNTGSTSTITADEALTIALKHAGVAKADAYIEKTEWDDGHYDIEFKSAGVEYDYEIAADGSIRKSEKDRDDDYVPAGTSTDTSTGSSTSSTASTSTITADEALTIALKHAGVVKVDAYIEKTEWDDGHYDIEFKSAGVEYDYEIATDGSIRKSQQDRDDDYVPAGTSSSTGSTSTITADEALTIALNHAGVAKADARVEKNEWDDDGHYEVEFKAGGMEYEYEIAADGSIRKAEKDHD